MLGIRYHHFFQLTKKELDKNYSDFLGMYQFTMGSYEMTRAGKSIDRFFLLIDTIQFVEFDWKSMEYYLPPLWGGITKHLITNPQYSFFCTPVSRKEGFSFEGINCRLNEVDENILLKVRTAPLATYCVAGLSFVVPQPEARAVRWRNLFSTEADVECENEIYRVGSGSYYTQWMDDEKYEELFQHTHLKVSSQPGDLAIIHLYSQDLERSEKILNASGFYTKRHLEPLGNRHYLFVFPRKKEEVAFCISEKKYDRWKQESSQLESRLLTNNRPFFSR